MAMTDAEQRAMCGETFGELLGGFDNRLFKTGTGVTYIAGFLSDAQELIALNRPEQARQILNAAKYLMFERLGN